MFGRRCRVALAAILVVALAGAIDAAAGAVWDQFAILVVLVALAGATLFTGRSPRSTVTVRADLARWLRERSAVEGEPVDALVDRSIGTYREHLVGPHSPPR